MWPAEHEDKEEEEDGEKAARKAGICTLALGPAILLASPDASPRTDATALRRASRGWGADAAAAAELGTGARCEAEGGAAGTDTTGPRVSCQACDHVKKGS